MSSPNPWAKRDAWRYESFPRAARFRNTFPGFGIAVVAFTLFCGYEKFVLQKDAHHEEHH
ncbi:hypothetical protein DICA3_A03312 [Diutina catenulata]